MSKEENIYSKWFKEWQTLWKDTKSILKFPLEFKKNDFQKSCFLLKALLTIAVSLPLNTGNLIRHLFKQIIECPFLNYVIAAFAVAPIYEYVKSRWSVHKSFKYIDKLNESRAADPQWLNSEKSIKKRMNDQYNNALLASYLLVFKNAKHKLQEELSDLTDNFYIEGKDNLDALSRYKSQILGQPTIQLSDWQKSDFQKSVITLNDDYFKEDQRRYWTLKNSSLPTKIFEDYNKKRNEMISYRDTINNPDHIKTLYSNNRTTYQTPFYR